MLGVAKFKRARFLLASTSEVYGDPQVHPQTEDYWGHVNPIGPRGVYDEAKRYAEALTMAYHRQQGVDTSIVRIFNTYGPRMRAHDGRAIPTFLRQALQDQPLTVFGDGEPDAQLLLRRRPDPRHRRAWPSPTPTMPVNIGNPNEFTLLELAKTVIEVTDSRSEIVYEPLPTDDPQQRQPDITRARDLLGWEPEVELRRACGGRSSSPASSASSAPPTERPPAPGRAAISSALWQATASPRRRARSAARSRPLVGPDDERVFTDSGIEIERLYTEDDVAPGPRGAPRRARRAARSPAASTRGCTATGSGRCASTPASPPPRTPTSATAT